MTGTTPPSSPGAQRTDDSVGDLVSRLTEQLSTLVRLELQLAQAELKAKGVRAGIGAGAFSVAAVLAYFAVGVLIACVIAALALVLPVWLAALIVAVVLLLVAGLLALIGKKQMARATPPIPRRMMDNVKRDVAMLKEGARS